MHKDKKYTAQFDIAQPIHIDGEPAGMVSSVEILSNSTIIKYNNCVKCQRKTKTQESSIAPILILNIIMRIVLIPCTDTSTDTQHSRI